MAESKVQVIIRCRPLNEQEKRQGKSSVIHCQTKTNEVTVKKKTYTFDKVYGQYASQKEIYKSTVKPIVEEALAGYNCTVFAYGQTGTGKTHTILGDLCPDNELAGIIPRSIRHIFDFLQQHHQDYSVRVSFLQLYNEELSDLLDPDATKKLRLMEDVKKGGVYCQNLTEVPTQTAKDVFALLEKGVSNRNTAETLLNENSSRSHCILTFQIHSKESTPGGEDLLRTGRLNLVDLAGSECIGRSGATAQRAREAGNINQSLLTLGRVITALVDKHPHVPYRDSKLTRLLQESLGGRAKTTVVATLAPCQDSLEETMSTLEYAYRAKNIKNCPVANQKLSKHAVLKEYNQEIDSLRKALQAARDKDGIFLNPAQFAEMQERLAGQATQISELEDAFEIKGKQCADMEESLITKTLEIERLNESLNETKINLSATKKKLQNTETELASTQKNLETSRMCLMKYHQNESVLLSQGEEGLKLFDDKVAENEDLRHRIDIKSKIEQHNEDLTASFTSMMVGSLGAMSERFQYCVVLQQDKYKSLHELINTTKNQYVECDETIKHALDDIKQITDNKLAGLDNKIDINYQHVQNLLLETENWTSETKNILNETIQSLITEIKKTNTTMTKDLNHIGVMLHEALSGIEETTQKGLHDANHFLEQHKQLLESVNNSFHVSHAELVEHIRSHEMKIKANAVESNEKSKEELGSLVKTISDLVSNFSQSQQSRHEQDIDYVIDSNATSLNILGGLASAISNHTTSIEKSTTDNTDTVRKLIHQFEAKTNVLVENICAQKDIMANQIANSMPVHENMLHNMTSNIASQCNILSQNGHSVKDSITTLHKECKDNICSLASEALQSKTLLLQKLEEKSNGLYNNMESVVQQMATSQQQIEKEMNNEVSDIAKQQQKVTDYHAACQTDESMELQPPYEAVFPDFSATVLSEDIDIEKIIFEKKTKQSKPSEFHNDSNVSSDFQACAFKENFDNASENILEPEETSSFSKKRRASDDDSTTTGIPLPKKYSKKNTMENCEQENVHP